jgi:hypothetical protein
MATNTGEAYLSAIRKSRDDSEPWAIIAQGPFKSKVFSLLSYEYDEALRLAVAYRDEQLNGQQPAPVAPKPSGISFYPHQDDYTNHGPKPSTKPKRQRGSTIKGEHHRLTKMLLAQERLNPGDEVKTSSCSLRELLAVAAHMDFTAEQTGRKRGRVFLHRKIDHTVALYVYDKFGIVVVPVRFEDEELEAVA